MYRKGLKVRLMSVPGIKQQYLPFKVLNEVFTITATKDAGLFFPYVVGSESMYLQVRTSDILPVEEN